MSETEKKHHIAFVDGMRAVCALYVLLHHAVIQYFSPDHLPEGPSAALVKLFFFGHLPVDAFIVISGFCIGLAYLSKDAGTVPFIQFMCRRFDRIVPPYLVALILSYMLAATVIGNRTGHHWDVSVPVTGKDLALHLVFIHDLFRSGMYKINHAMWSVAVEFRIYFFFPLIYWLLKRTSMLVLFLSTLLFSVLIAWASLLLFGSGGDFAFNLSGVHPYIILFATGVIVSCLYIQRHRPIPAWVLLLIQAGALAGWYRLQSAGGRDLVSQAQFNHLGDVVFGLAVGAFLLQCCLASQESKRFGHSLMKLLSSTMVVRCGIFSYSLYLIHAPLIQLLTVYVTDLLPVNELAKAAALGVLCLLFIVPLAFLFFQWCERPFMGRNGISMTSVIRRLF